MYLIDNHVQKIFNKLLNTFGFTVVNNSEQHITYKIGSSYIPQPIKYIVDKLNIFKKSIKCTNEIAKLKKTCNEPIPQNTSNFVDSPLLEFKNDNLAKMSHIKSIISKVKSGKQPNANNTKEIMNDSCCLSSYHSPLGNPSPSVPLLY